MKRFCLLLFLLPFGLFVVLSCRGSEKLVGKYESVDSLEGDSPMTLVLKSDGKGFWTVREEEVPFQWDTKDDQVLLHSKSGGVIAGNVGQDNSIDLTLPGVGRFVFKKL